MHSDVVIVDYGSGNIRSMENALRRVVRPDQRVLVSGDAAVVRNAERVVVPGVGAFAECRRKLEGSGMLGPLLDVASDGRPVLGVCVGLQILADEGHEHEVCSGLGLVPGLVRRLTFGPEHEGPRKLPHVGWSPVWPGPAAVFEGIAPGTYFYFVHSYVLDLVESADIAATAHYGETFAAAILRRNLLGCQFHPEKSGASGLQLLSNFCRWQ